MMFFLRFGTFVLLLISLAIGVLGFSCSTMKPLNYTVAVINEGRENVWFKPFQLTDAADTIVEFGEVFPSGRKSIAPYYCRPATTLDLSWRFLKSGEERQAQAAVNLPKEFTKKRGSAIVIHFKPEEGTVAVTYEIIDPKTGQMIVIQQGKRSTP